MYFILRSTVPWVHFTHRVPSNIYLAISNIHKIYIFIPWCCKTYPLYILILLINWYWRTNVRLYCHTTGISLTFHTRTALYFDTADMLALQNIPFILTQLIYWYLKICSHDIGIYDILVFCMLMPTIYWYCRRDPLFYLNIIQKMKGEWYNQEGNFHLHYQHHSLVTRNLSAIGSFKIFWGDFLILFLDYMKFICNRILCFVPRWIGWHFNALATREGCKFSWELVARHFRIVIQILRL